MGSAVSQEHPQGAWHSSLPHRQAIVLLFLVKQVFPEPPDFLFVIGIFGEILYKHFLFVPGPYDLERCLKVRNTLQSAMAMRLSHIPGIVKL